MTRENKPFDYGDLYVMQAECGLIKVGRSTDVAKRLQQVSTHVIEPVQLVASFSGRGAEEDAILKALSKYHVINEWFQGTGQVRAVLKRRLGVEPDVWPFTWKPSEVEAFWSHVRFMTGREYLRKLRCDVRGAIKAGCSGKELEADIFRSLKPLTVCVEYPSWRVTRYGPGDTIEGPMDPPNYLGDVEMAHSVGPPGWPGLPAGATPGEIVIAALEALAKHENQLAAEYRNARIKAHEARPSHINQQVK